MKKKPVKPKICKICQGEFLPFSTTQKACGIKCAIEWGKEQERKKAEKLAREIKKRNAAELKAFREATKTKGQLFAEAQAAFNAWIRERDRDRPCISCGAAGPKFGEALTGGFWDAGHYKSVGSAPELRFEPLNVHKQCKRCNRQLDGNIVNYRAGLLARIGTKKVEWLEGPHPAARYSREALRDLARIYRQKLKELKEGEGAL